MNQNQTIVPINIEDELRTSFLDYSMSVIVSRALPDVRDGLKPVQRRIFYAMHGMKNFSNKPYLKSARIVGDVLGRLHPHGDSSVYAALVRLAQYFSLRYPLVDGQGNFGSIDGDSAAAMRYTEVRLQKLAELLLLDIEKETVDFVPNYDNKETEPVVLPARIPQLLINGASGIAVGMATNIPPHNITEVIDATLAMIDEPKITIDDLLKIVKGPDFPTAGYIMGHSGIVSASKTGRGSIVMRAKTNIEEMPNNKQRIVVTELPYQVNKARLLEKIADLVRNKKIESISDLRDESAQEDIRVVIELKRGEQGEIVLNNLYKLTQLQTSFGVNTVALVRGVPRVLNLKEILEYFYEHRREVILRRTAFDLRKAEDRAHILQGLKTAVENIDEVVSIIRGSKDAPSAHAALIKRLELSDIQTKAILDMRLAKLTGLEREKIINEYNEILEVIKDLKDILNNAERVKSIVKAELNELRDSHGDERRTKILAAANDITMESLVSDEGVAVTITHGGYVKRTSLDEIKAQKRGGKGKSGMLTRGEDFVRDVFNTTNHQDLLCFSNKGKVFSVKVYQIPEAQLRSKGTHIARVVKLSDGEKIVSILPIKVFEEESFIVSVSKNGYVKKTDMMAYSKIRETGIIGIKIDDGDQLIGCSRINKGDDILIGTRQGKAIRFKGDDLRPMGRGARGVTGIRFGEDDAVIGMEVLKNEEGSAILSVCENGYGKRTLLGEYRTQTRGGKGIYTIKVTERNGPVIGLQQVFEDDDIMVMTSSGKLMRFTVKEIGVIGRLTQGVKIMSVDAEEKVISICKVAEVDGEEVS